MNKDGKISVREFKSAVLTIVLCLDRLPKLKNHRYELHLNRDNRTLKLTSNFLTDDREIIVIDHTDIESFQKRFRNYLTGSISKGKKS